MTAFLAILSIGALMLVSFGYRFGRDCERYRVAKRRRTLAAQILKLN